MRRSSGKVRWLEPTGQTIAFAAFSTQFFVVEPDSTAVMRGYFEREFGHIIKLQNQLKGLQPPPTLPEILIGPALPQLEALPIKGPSEHKRRWRLWLFALFALGGLFTVAGKTASVRYSTK